MFQAAILLEPTPEDAQAHRSDLSQGESQQGTQHDTPHALENAPPLGDVGDQSPLEQPSVAGLIQQPSVAGLIQQPSVAGPVARKPSRDCRATAPAETIAQGRADVLVRDRCRDDGALPLSPAPQQAPGQGREHGAPEEGAVEDGALDSLDALDQAALDDGLVSEAGATEETWEDSRGLSGMNPGQAQEHLLGSLLSAGARHGYQSRIAEEKTRATPNAPPREGTRSETDRSDSASQQGTSGRRAPRGRDDGRHPQQSAVSMCPVFVYVDHIPAASFHVGEPIKQALSATAWRSYGLAMTALESPSEGLSSLVARFERAGASPP